MRRCGNVIHRARESLAVLVNSFAFGVSLGRSEYFGNSWRGHASEFETWVQYLRNFSECERLHPQPADRLRRHYTERQFAVFSCTSMVLHGYVGTVLRTVNTA